jgi:hypothetical protein
MANRWPGKSAAVQALDNFSGVYPSPNRASFGVLRVPPDLNPLALPISLCPFRFFSSDRFSDRGVGGEIGGPGHLFDINPHHGKERKCMFQIKAFSG